MEVNEPLPGWTGGVYTLDGHTRFSVDDEADAAQFCSDGPVLVAAMRREVARLNGDASELARAMGEAKASELECLEADGTTPKLPALPAAGAPAGAPGRDAGGGRSADAERSRDSRSGASHPTTMRGAPAPSVFYPTGR